jgi:RNA 2',3'-cyclic 3'-phosphodiesterase
MTAAGSVEDDVRIRLFCGLALPDGVVEEVMEWQAGLPHEGLRVVPPDNLHLTLAFLGHRPRRDVDPIAAELEAATAAASPMSFSVRSYRETRSVGMLAFADEGGAGTALATDLHARLERLGVYEREQRPWLPHLTVVRFREQPRLRPELPDLGAVGPSGAAVYHSLLRPTGARYVVLHEFRLGSSC